MHETAMPALEPGSTRLRVLDHIRQNPGSHMRKLQRDLSMALGTLEYHLYQLERSGLLVIRQLGRYKCYYSNDMDRRDKDLLYYLRQEMPRRIALEAADQPGITFAELAARMPIRPSTLSFHLRKLIAAGVLVAESAGRGKAYRCVEPERVRKLILEYKPTFADDVVDRFAAAWLDLSPEPAAQDPWTTPATVPQRAPFVAPA